MLFRSPVIYTRGGGMGEGVSAVRPGSPGRLFRSSHPQKGTLPPGLARFDFFAQLRPGPCFIYLNAARCTQAAVYIPVYCYRKSPALLPGLQITDLFRYLNSCIFHILLLLNRNCPTSERIGQFFGSPCWTRTNDPAVNSRMLYRLS